MGTEILAQSSRTLSGMLTLSLLGQGLLVDSGWGEGCGFGHRAVLSVGKPTQCLEELQEVNGVDLTWQLGRRRGGSRR